ncbi:LEM3 (ligand-effect modulator 3) / CDC50 family protein [Babesia bovis T2Bo]|uniref:Uncharacterized protein n=1 Tax=Babesia bovis TaxID=5865 RepID=A7ASF5_BABBO|nr:LEM3 (ligand-effect modulator 3) / CDC50 family protein [Babesia bovis T2Bo]EDO07474.1 LEM3 (ligand-effect modulator 3) / CDC50 family protein [Babesia bovis T2Bo]|eukprot:XP_001611042.1 hypothetical protein [Babesia bovis T2Bo]
MTATDERDRDTRSAHSTKVMSRYYTGSLNSIKGVAMSFASYEFGTSGSFDAGVTIRDVLSRRATPETRAEGLRQFRKDSSQQTFYNSKRVGIVLIIMGLINTLLFTVIQITRSSHVECSIPIVDDATDGQGEWSTRIDSSNCIGDVSKFKQADKINVYYTIHNYPFHAASVFGLHSKSQLEGKEVSKDEVWRCYPFNHVLEDGKEQQIYPCGPHLWNLYNDTFSFSRRPLDKTQNGASLKDDIIPLDESQHILANYQEHADARNPLDQTISHLYKNVYYWLHSTSNMATLQSAPNKSQTQRDGKYPNKKTLAEVRAIEKLMTAPNAGTGVENGHVIQWMTPSPFKTIKKLYGVLKGPIEFPIYVNAHIGYDTAKFGGRKTLSLVVPSWPYGKLTSVQTFIGTLVLLSFPLSLILLLSKTGDTGRCVNLI